MATTIRVLSLSLSLITTKCRWDSGTTHQRSPRDLTKCRPGQCFVHSFSNKIRMPSTMLDPRKECIAMYLYTLHNHAAVSDAASTSSTASKKKKCRPRVSKIRQECMCASASACVWERARARTSERGDGDGAKEREKREREIFCNIFCRCWMGCSWCQQDDSPTVRDQDSSYHPANNRGGEDPAGVDEGKTQDISNILLVKNNCGILLSRPQ